MSLNGNTAIDRIGFLVSPGYTANLQATAAEDITTTAIAAIAIRDLETDLEKKAPGDGGTTMRDGSLEWISSITVSETVSRS
jgi:hypothetical protein